MQKIGDSFWRRLTVDFFPSLIIQQKWHVGNRNLRVGDIVMIQQESGKVKGKWRLGRIAKTEPSDRDGAVRKVDIQYKNTKSKSFVTVRRAVQKGLLSYHQLNMMWSMMNSVRMKHNLISEKRYS